MRSNPFRVAILLWFTAWLLVVVPGHTRGIVKLPGPDIKQASCCEAGDQADNECDSPEIPFDDPANHCAICFIKATLTDPPPVTLYTPFLGKLDELAYTTEGSVCNDQSAPHCMRGRGPPA